MYLLALELLLSDAESILQQLLLLLDVAGLQAGSDGCRWVASSVHDVLAVVVLSLVQDGLDTWLGEGPGTGVKWLLLGPDDGLGVLVGVKVLLKLLPWEWSQLLNASDDGISDVVVGTVLQEGSVDLTSA